MWQSLVLSGINVAPDIKSFIANLDDFFSGRNNCSLMLNGSNGGSGPDGKVSCSHAEPVLVRHVVDRLQDVVGVDVAVGAGDHAVRSLDLVLGRVGIGVTIVVITSHILKLLYYMRSWHRK